MSRVLCNQKASPGSRLQARTKVRRKEKGPRLCRVIRTRLKTHTVRTGQTTAAPSGLTARTVRLPGAARPAEVFRRHRPRLAKACSTVFDRLVGSISDEA